jgi:serine protease AprX
VQVARSVSWDDSKKGRRRAAVVALVALLVVPVPFARSGTHRASNAPLITVIVQARPGQVAAARRSVVAAAGTVEHDLASFGGFVATAPADAVGALSHAAGVASVTADRSVQLHGVDDDYDARADPGSLARNEAAIGARSVWAQGGTGAGVDVALIDSGVAPVEGLRTPGKIVNGPDLSFESQAPDLRYLDTFGHGTHLAGIIAGRDDTVTGIQSGDSLSVFGVAPGARIVSVKVANALGATDVSQVIAAIDWVVQHQHDDGLNIRVLNLSFGTDGDQDPSVDPLIHAVDVAWQHGIVVVVAAGNRGGAGRLDTPARSEHVIAVGADDTNGTSVVTDDAIPSWSSTGNDERAPDVVAPGRSIASLRDPGSFIDQTYPDARVGDRLFRGSGTSAATAFVSGAAALLLGGRPSLTPDQVKALLMSTARPLDGVAPERQGQGLINLRTAIHADDPDVPDPADDPIGAGTGTLEGSRGSAHVGTPDAELRGEEDIFGHPWDGVSWAAASTSASAWTGGTWNGSAWAGDGWTASSWDGPAWATTDWPTGPDTPWDANSWDGNAWTGNSWTGNSWSGNSWSGNSWSGNSWSGNSWSFVEPDASP